VAFCSTESEKRGFHFPHESMTHIAGHGFGRPTRGTLTTFYKVINFSSYHIQTVVKANAKYSNHPKALPDQGIINYMEMGSLLHPSLKIPLWLATRSRECRQAF